MRFYTNILAVFFLIGSLHAQRVPIATAAPAHNTANTALATSALAQPEGQANSQKTSIQTSWENAGWNPNMPVRTHITLPTQSYNRAMKYALHQVSQLGLMPQSAFLQWDAALSDWQDFTTDPSDFATIFPEELSKIFASDTMYQQSALVAEELPRYKYRRDAALWDKLLEEHQTVFAAEQERLALALAATQAEDDSAALDASTTAANPTLNTKEQSDAEDTIDPYQQFIPLATKAELERLIWHALLQYPNPSELINTTLNNDDVSESDDEEAVESFNGWAALANIYRNYDLNQENLHQLLTLWEHKYQPHPAQDVASWIYWLHNNNLTPENFQGNQQGNLQENLTEETLAEGQPLFPESIAVLLPLSGEFLSAGNLLLDGIQAGFYRLGASADWWPHIHIYDTNLQNLSTIVNEAYANGVRNFIGPLLRDNVIQMQTLAKSKATALNVVALNRTSLLQPEKPAPEKPELKIPAAPDTFWQYSLVVEDEIDALIDYAHNKGWDSGGGLFIESPWGLRSILQFERLWVNRGKKWLGAEGIPKSGDISQLGKNILSVLESEKRIAEVARLLGKNLVAVPRRRSDVDFLFMSVNSDSAARFLSTLQYNYAKDIPVLALSPTFRPDVPETYFDLAKVVFTDMPWMTHPVESAKNRLLDELVLEDQYRNRFFAMGVDSLQLLLLLASGKPLHNIPVSGLTGLLTVEHSGIVKRRPHYNIVKIDSGSAQIIAVPPPKNLNLADQAFNPHEK